MKKVVTKRRPKTKIITSPDDILVEVVYAEPSAESEKILDEVIGRVYQFGVSRRYFLTAET